MKPVKRRIFLMIAVTALAALACTQLTVKNDSHWQLRVAVTLPGGSGQDVHVYEPGASYDYYPDSAGKYTITVYPGEDYINFMNETKIGVGEFFVTKHEEVEPYMVVELVEGINQIEKVLANLQEATCTGTLVEDETVNARIKFTTSGAYIMDCP